MNEAFAAGKKLAFVTCVSDVEVLRRCLLASPCIAQGRWPLQAFFNARDAASAFNGALAVTPRHLAGVGAPGCAAARRLGYQVPAGAGAGGPAVSPGSGGGRVWRKRPRSRSPPRRPCARPWDIVARALPPALPGRQLD